MGVIPLAEDSMAFQSLLGIELTLLVYVSPPKAIQRCWQERAAPVTNGSKPPEVYYKQCGRTISLYPNMDTSLRANYGGSQPLLERCYMFRLSVLHCLCTVLKPYTGHQMIRDNGMSRKVRTITTLFWEVPGSRGERNNTTTRLTMCQFVRGQRIGTTCC